MEIEISNHCECVIKDARQCFIDSNGEDAADDESCCQCPCHKESDAPTDELNMSNKSTLVIAMDPPKKILWRSKDKKMLNCWWGERIEPNGDRTNMKGVGGAHYLQEIMFIGPEGQPVTEFELVYEGSKIGD